MLFSLNQHQQRNSAFAAVQNLSRMRQCLFLDQQEVTCAPPKPYWNVDISPEGVREVVIYLP